MDTAARSKKSSKSAFNPLLARLTERNLLVIPTVVTDEFAGIDTFEVNVENGKIVFTPLEIPSADAVRDNLAARGITEKDVAEAVEWARGRGR